MDVKEPKAVIDNAHAMLKTQNKLKSEVEHASRDFNPAKKQAMLKSANTLDTILPLQVATANQALSKSKWDESLHIQ